MSSPELTPAQRRAETLAKIFDLRMFIGSLFIVFGVAVTAQGASAGRADIAKAAGINLALWTGLIMLATGLGFVAWTLVAPPEVFHGHEVTEDDLPEQLRHQGLEDVPEHHREPPDQPRRRPTGH
jgi:hypothetical protein